MDIWSAVMPLFSPSLCVLLPANQRACCACTVTSIASGLGTIYFNLTHLGIWSSECSLRFEGTTARAERTSLMTEWQSANGACVCVCVCVRASQRCESLQLKFSSLRGCGPGEGECCSHYSSLEMAAALSGAHSCGGKSRERQHLSSAPRLQPWAW